MYCHYCVGIVEPVKGGVEAGLRLGVGKAEQDTFYMAADNVVRKKLEVEVQADEDQSRRDRREVAAFLCPSCMYLLCTVAICCCCAPGHSTASLIVCTVCTAHLLEAQLLQDPIAGSYCWMLGLGMLSGMFAVYLLKDLKIQLHPCAFDQEHANWSMTSAALPRAPLHAQLSRHHTLHILQCENCAVSIVQQLLLHSQCMTPI